MPKEALKITKKTYHIYRQHVLGIARVFDEIDVENHYFVRDTVVTTSWSWMSKETFDEFYKFVEQENPTGFAAVTIR